MTLLLRARQSLSCGLLTCLLISPLFAHAEGEDDPLWKKSTYEKKVFHVGQRLLERNNIQERIVFRVLDDRQKQRVNASAKEAIGRVTITENLLHFIENDDELAAVLGHEIAHITLRHRSERRPGRYARATLITAPLSVGIPYFGYKLSDKINTVIENPTRRRQELEADAESINLLAGAGYNPHAMYNVMLKISGDGTRWDIWRSHPTGSRRLDAIQKKLQEWDTANSKKTADAATDDSAGEPETGIPAN